MKEKNIHTVDVWGKHSHRGKHTLPSFAIEKIFNLDMPHIVVKKIPENTDIEDTYVFQELLKHFNNAYWTNLSSHTLMHSRSSFDGFMKFITLCLVKRYLIITKECEDTFFLNIEKIRNKYAQNLSSVQRYYDEVVRACYQEQQWIGKENQRVRDEMDFFVQAYSLMKVVFRNEKRDSWEKYFEHLKGVMEIVLRELPNPNLNKVLIALLHDVQEDIPEYADMVRKVYGDYIAKAVEKLSKKDWRLYLTEEEKILCWSQLEEEQKIFDEVREILLWQNKDKSFTATNKIKESEVIKAMNSNQKERYTIIQKQILPFMKKAKEGRNKDYFGHLEWLNDDEIDVKFADRIHNLRDIEGITKEKALRKIKETKKYFLHVAKKRNPTAYNLMTIEINNLNALFGNDIDKKQCSDTEYK